MTRPSSALMGGKYLLGEPLGAGGMGLVFAATQPELQRAVAVKILRAELAGDERMVRHFRREALAAARVSHPGLVGMFDVGATDDGLPFLVMEQVTGRMLSTLVREQLLTLDRSCDLVSQLLDALAVVHRAGIVHADVKSDNLLIERGHDGRSRMRLLDFGLAGITPIGDQRADDPVFQDDRVIDLAGNCYVSGTPAYMAPEVIEGRAPTAASDLYAVGVILYELLTGAVPFSGDSAVVIMMRHLTETAIPPSLRRTDRYIPPAVEEVVLRALEKAPEDRFPDAGAFAAALAAALPPSSTARWCPDCGGPIPAAHDLCTWCLPVREERPVTPARESTTQVWQRPGPAHRTRPRLARGSRPRLDPDGERLRCAIADALTAGDIDELTRGYLELAAMLDGRGERRAAIRELIEGVDVVSAGGGPTGRRAAMAVERLHGAMAALRVPGGRLRH